MNSLNRKDKTVLWYTMTTNRCLLLKLFIAICLQVKTRQTYWCKSTGIFPKKCGNLEQLSLLFKNIWPEIFKNDIFSGALIYIYIPWIPQELHKRYFKYVNTALCILCMSVKQAHSLKCIYFRGWSLNAGWCQA